MSNDPQVQVGRVLLVDDQVDRAGELLSALASTLFHFDVTDEVPDLEGALGSSSPWDCVLCHVGLSNVSWASVRRAMRNFDVQVPVIVLADDRDMDSMTTALGLGATDFFVKPRERPGLLMRSIERGVNHRRLQRALEASNNRLEHANTELRHSLRVLEHDQQAGRQVQMALLPAAPLRQDEYWFSHKIVPSLYLSGDFTDFSRRCIGSWQLLGVCDRTAEKSFCAQALRLFTQGRSRCDVPQRDTRTGKHRTA